MADVTELDKRIAGLALPPEKRRRGAAALMEEVAATKISGEEDRYSHTDLWDFKANFDGSKKIYDLVRPLDRERRCRFRQEVDDSFAHGRHHARQIPHAKGYETMTS